MAIYPFSMTSKNYLACCYWFTGLSGAGKTTLANCIHGHLTKQGIATVVLDGDQLRKGLNADLGFSREDRRENVRRIAQVARILVESGYIVLVSAIAPYEEDRKAARDLFKLGQFFEVYVATDLKTCMERDSKGLYAKAKIGELEYFTGWDDPYEEPITPEFIISTAGLRTEQAASPIFEHLFYINLPILITDSS